MANGSAVGRERKFGTDTVHIFSALLEAKQRANGSERKP